jgi:hypothetical protein
LEGKNGLALGAGGKQMPKDAKRNVDRQKLSSGHLIEPEAHLHEGEPAEQPRAELKNLTPGALFEERTQPRKEIARKAQQLAEKRASKAGAIRGASAKTLAARKAAKK